ncbi:hypothetical protein ACLESD_36335 [Pyxidicoccus sp. 3LFB2]
MSWRGAVGVLVALLLPLPLVLVMGSVLRDRRERTATPPGAVRTVPVLSHEERMVRLTYHHECQKPEDCEAPLACFSDTHQRSHYCTDSECTTDAQCPEGQRCLALTTPWEGLRVRWCVAVGVRQEGEPCLDQALDPREGCSPGLVCGGRLGWCGRPCRPGEAPGCPEGFFCGEVTPEPICLPTCETRGCPQGQRCVRQEEGISACAVVYGADCQHTPCPEGRECRDTRNSARPGEIWMECLHKCGKNRPPCPDGLICDRARCQPPCDPNGPNVCAPGYHCTRRTKRSPYLCEPDTWPKL